MREITGIPYNPSGEGYVFQGGHFHVPKARPLRAINHASMAAPRAEGAAENAMLSVLLGQAMTAGNYDFAAQELLGLCLREGIPVYRQEDVDEYMEAAVAREDALGWGWTGIGSYRLGLPSQILDRALRLRNAVRGSALLGRFAEPEIEVSDCRAEIPDPFIRLRFAGTSVIRRAAGDPPRLGISAAFGVWDEPGINNA